MSKVTDITQRNALHRIHIFYNVYFYTNKHLLKFRIFKGHFISKTYAKKTNSSKIFFTVAINNVILIQTSDNKWDGWEIER